MITPENLQKAVIWLLRGQNPDWLTEEELQFVVSLCKWMVEEFGITSKGINDLAVYSGATIKGTWQHWPERKARMQDAISFLESIVLVAER